MSPSFRRGAMTLVEVLVAVGLVLLLLGFVFRASHVQVLAWFTVERLEALQQVRVARARLLPIIETATEVLHPPVGTGVVGGAPASTLVITDGTYRPRLLFLGTDGCLKLREVDGTSTTLVEDVRAFSVRQPVRGQVLCEVTVAADDEGRGASSVLVAATLTNGHGGEGGQP